MSDIEKAAAIAAGLALLWWLARQQTQSSAGAPSKPIGAGGKFGGAGNTGGW